MREGGVAELEEVEGAADKFPPAFKGGERMGLGASVPDPIGIDGVSSAQEQGTVLVSPAVEIFDGEGASIGVFFVISELDFAQARLDIFAVGQSGVSAQGKLGFVLDEEIAFGVIAAQEPDAPG